MKRNLDTGVKVHYNKVKKEQRRTTDEQPNMYLKYLLKTNISNYKADLLEGNN